WGARREPHGSRAPRRGGPVRGLSAVPVPPFCAEEPPALALRGALAPLLGRGQRGAVLDAYRGAGARRGRARRGFGALVGSARFRGGGEGTRHRAAEGVGSGRARAP